MCYVALCDRYVTQRLVRIVGVCVWERERKGEGERGEREREREREQQGK